MNKLLNNPWLPRVLWVFAAAGLLGASVVFYGNVRAEQQADSSFAELQEEVDGIIPQDKRADIFTEIETRQTTGSTSTTTTTTSTVPETTTAPSSSISTTTTPTTTTSTTTTLPAGPVQPTSDEIIGVVDIPRLNLEFYPVVVGDPLFQDSTPKGHELASNATGYTHPGWLDDIVAGIDQQLLAPTPGTGYTFGVGGHKTSEGGPFANLETLQEGDIVIFSGIWGVTYVYEYYSEVNAGNDPDSFWDNLRSFEWFSPEEEFLVLYTCEYSNGYSGGTAANRYMVGFRLVDQFATPGE